jgi:alginate O-acetyltransferase complex protein AlgJ
MKKKVVGFVGLLLVLLAIVPVIHLISGDAKRNRGEIAWSKASLYNFDIALPYLSAILYKLGISIAPNQTMVGKEGWLFLGDLYEKTITAKRFSASEEDAASAKQIALATKAWEQWLKLNGVSQYRILLSPNKNTIYSEFLPLWAQPAIYTSTDALVDKVNKDVYVDIRSNMKLAKAAFGESLYYKTDTHWNALGAWVAYHNFSNSFDPADGLRWLRAEKDVLISSSTKRAAGDLAGFLRLKDIPEDSEVGLSILSEQPITTEQYNFDTDQHLASTTNPQTKTEKFPLVVKSVHALNKKKVLWLRDSFGIALSPFMAATFTETLQLHYEDVDPQQLIHLVETYKPDYVFVTVVERNSRHQFFKYAPPLHMKNERSVNFTTLSQVHRSDTHDLSKIEGSKALLISGVDPHYVFTLANSVKSQEASQLIFNLNCGDGREPVEMQVLWQAKDKIMNEANSVRFEVKPGTVALGLSPIHAWAKAGEVTAIRIDIDSPKTCPKLSVDNVELGR